MKVPCVEDFMESFGMKPVETKEDPDLRIFLYRAKSNDGKLEIDFSFSEIMSSFQILLRCCDREIGVICSEKMQKIEIYKEKYKSGIKVVFEISGCSSEVDIIIEPDLYYHWSILQTAPD